MKRPTVILLSLVAVSGIALLYPSAESSAQSGGPPKTSPLSAYPGFGHNDRADETRFIREEAERERAIASCMRDAGFRYNPAPSVAVTGPMLNPAGKSAGPIDQNERYARSLTDDKRREYYMALYGIPDPNDQTNLWDPRSTTGGGCSGNALRAIPGVYAGRSALIEEYETMLTEVRADGRVKQAEAKWAECAKSKGLSFASPTVAYADLDLNPQGSAARRLLIAECAASSSLNETAADVRAEHEARFVTRHKVTLEKMKGAQ